MILISLVFLFSQLATAYPNHGILGHWEAQNTVLGRGVEFNLAFEFTEHRMNLKVACHYYDGAYLQSSASSHVNYRGSDIIIRENNENVANDGYRYCSAALRPSVWTSHYDGYGRLVLYSPTPYQSQFYLVRMGDWNKLN